MINLSRIFAVISILILVVFSTSGQVDHQSIRIQVLEKGLVDSTFIFGKWTESGRTETHLRYLGSVTTKHGHTFKMMNSIWFWGLSHHATTRILVFNDKNQYVGNYFLTMTSDLPSQLIDGKLIFRNTDNDCDKKLITVIDLKKGLPKYFFRKCQGKYGDIYDFENN